jgi:transcriptional regulator with GAF, ATPase, and Fis domain
MADTHDRQPETSTLTLRDAFAGVAVAARAIVPFERMGISLLEDPGTVRVHLLAGPGAEHFTEHVLARPHYSGCLWPAPGGGPIRIRDSARELDLSYPIDRRVVDAGRRSVLAISLEAQGTQLGVLWFDSHRVEAFSTGDAIALRPVADLLAVAVVLWANRIADHVALALAHERLAEEGRRAAQAREREARLQERVETLVHELEGRGAQRALGNSTRWKDALLQAAKVAGTDTTVLVTGESGTGKEVVARYIHRGSKRARGPFIALNCAALPEQLLESELFGYERGAFAGAQVARAGKIEQAAGGVLFLDEAGEMTPAVQAKFLRVLQEREFQRLGGAKTLKADVRVIAATNRDPREALERGTLREDLYYRLSVFEIALPPLRERSEDILVLADAFLAEVGRSVGRPAAGFSEDAREQLLAHAWPGNVRELRNAIERAVILCQGGLITSAHLPMNAASSHGRPAPLPPASIPAEGVTLEQVEHALLVKALAQARNNKSQAAKLLGLPRGQLYSLLRRHGLTEARR